ncbi:hypothetical protein DL765_007301 [Monosporascus sp. GIB2]|nr:hypothetical protein DL765_007301 [Monosporascus sp. GIB2]
MLLPETEELVIDRAAPCIARAVSAEASSGPHQLDGVAGAMEAANAVQASRMADNARPSIDTHEEAARLSSRLVPHFLP